jgi:type VI secretion system protein ImpG
VARSFLNLHDRSFLNYYERELKHLRETAGEFAAQFPKVAGRLGLDAFASADPYVERLMEAFAFLTARIQQRLGAGHAEFTAHMLELLYPSFLAPTPSMAVMQLVPNLRHGSLNNGVVIPRGSIMRSALGDQQTACEYRTGHPVTLWPFELEAAEYRTSNLRDLMDTEHLGVNDAKAALRLVLRGSREVSFDQLPLDRLPLFIRGGDRTSVLLYEQLVRSSSGIVVQSADRPYKFMRAHRGNRVKTLGFDESQALLPVGNNVFDGYRLLQEFFAFPERFMFAELTGLRELMSVCNDSKIEIILLFDRADPRLDGVVRASHLSLFCTPAINLFPRVGDRVRLEDRDYEYHILPDRTRPLDYEVHSITRVAGCGQDGRELCEFSPMYAPTWSDDGSSQRARYALRRQARPRVPGKGERENDTRLPYVPSDVYLSLVDGNDGPFRSGLRQLSVNTLCTNRALPLAFALGADERPFSAQSHGAIVNVRCVAGPTAPRVSPAFGELSWSFLSHLSLDFMTLIRRDGRGAAALRQLLDLYGNYSDDNARAQSRAIVDVETRGVVRALPRRDGPLSFGRGLEVVVTCDEDALEGTGAVVLGAVLERFFAKYASINSFVETAMCTQQRGEVMRWPATPGQRTPL